MKKISLFIVTIGLLFSCKKAELDLYPYNQIETTQAFNTENDVNLALNGIYQGLRSAGSYYQGSWNIEFEVVSDNLILNQQGRLSQQTFFNWQYTGNGTTGLFGNGYSLIRRANAILENIDKVNSTATFKNNVKGQALAIRALVHFDLTRAYAKTFNNASASDSTVPYIISTDAAQMPSKEPVPGFYAKIVKDLTDAESNIGSANGVGKLSKAAVQGILSKVYLYMGDWDKTISSATSSIGAVPAIGSLSSFSGIWTDASEVGVLFKIKNTLTDNLNTLGVNYYQIVGGGIKSEYNVAWDFYQLFQANDIRKTAYTLQAVYNGTNYNHVVKYAGKSGFPLGVLDAKVLRSAEVLLNRAEAYARKGGAANEALALADVLLLKSNRYTSYTNESLTGQTLLDEIYLQRRLELAFEGDRFFDLKRRNLPVIRSDKGDKADGTGTAATFKKLDAGDFKFNFPLPQSELNFNKNLVQVPGY